MTESSPPTRRRDRRSASQAPVYVGLLRKRGEPGPCGLCGAVGQLTRTHVPPQCAGNDHGVQRHYLLATDREGQPTIVQGRKRLHGGLYVFGLCGTCNSAAGLYDGAYGELAAGLRSCWASGSVIVPQNKITLPSVACSPGAVARSVLMGLFGVNHVLRERFPELAVGLLARTHPMTLPSELRLRVALASGTTACLTGAIHTSLMLPPTSNGKIRRLLSDAAVYFPPLAWQLVGPDSELLDDHGWGDASDWLPYFPPDRADVRGLLPSLPLVRPLNHDPEFADRLVHMLSDELAPIVECDGLMLP